MWQRTLIGLLLVVSWTGVGVAAGKKQVKALIEAVERVEQQVDRFEELVDAKQYREAAELVDALAKDDPDNAVVRLMQRQVKLLAANGPQANVQRAAPQMVVMTYPVADLVIPVGRHTTVAMTRARGKHGVDGIASTTPKGKVDYTSLIERITESIAPDSWNAAGGDGSLAPNESTLSLVVRNTPDVQQEVADLLRQLRRLQDIQVTAEIRYIEVPESFFERIGVDFDLKAAGNDRQPLQLVRHEFHLTELGGKLADTGETTLSDTEMRTFIQQVQSDTRSNIVFAPKVTLFSGQCARIAYEETDLGILLQTTVTHDRRHVRVKTARDAADPLDVLASASTFTVQDGHSIVIDRGTREVTLHAVADPVLRNVPYVNRLFKNTAVRSRVRQLMVVTPRVIVQEEEEELILDFSTATPRGVLQDIEEEPLLGLE